MFAEWKRVRVHIDYHVELEGHYYSVPYQLVRREIELRYTARTVECFHQGQRVASHRRSPLKGRHTHGYRAHARPRTGSTPSGRRSASCAGPHTPALRPPGVIEHILTQRRHPQQGFRSCLGIMRLGKRYGAERLEAACVRALALGACTYKSLESILRQGLENEPVPQTPEPATALEHGNVRGAAYYH